MAKHLTKPFITEMQAEGSATERSGELGEATKKARVLLRGIPPDVNGRRAYVKTQLTKALNGEIEDGVFKQFIILSNCWDEFELCGLRMLKQYGDRFEQFRKSCMQ